MSRYEWQWHLHGQQLVVGEAIQLRAQGVWLTGHFAPVNDGAIPTLTYPCRAVEGAAGAASDRSPIGAIVLNTEMELRRASDPQAEPGRLVRRSAREGPSPLQRECA